MTNITIYHNPRCSKSRKALSLLRDRGFEPKIIEYLKTPPSKDELKKILRMLGLRARDLMRKTEPAYGINHLNDDCLSEDQLIEMIIENPILMERPVILTSCRAVVGRPPENVLTII